MKHELEFHAGRVLDHTDPDQEADRVPINYLQMLVKYRWWLCLGAGVGLVLGQLAYWKFGPEYAATAQINVHRKYSAPVRVEERFSSADVGNRTEHLKLITTHAVLSKAVELGKLDTLPSFRGSGDDLADDLRSSLGVKRVAGSDRSFDNLIDVSFACKNSRDAVEVVKAVLDAYANYLEESSSESNTKRTAIAERQLEQLQDKLRQHEKAYLEFRDQAPLQWRTAVGVSSPDGQATTTNVHQERVIDLEDQRRKIPSKRAEINSRIANLRQAETRGEPRERLEQMVRRFLIIDSSNGSNAAVAATASTNPSSTAFEQRLIPLLLEESRMLRAGFGKDHPDLRGVRESIKQVQEFYRELGVQLPGSVGRPKPQPAKEAEPQQDFIDLYIQSLELQLRELAFKDQELEKIVGEETAKAKEFARYQAQDQSMSDELTELRKLYAKALGLKNEIALEKDNTGYTFRQTNPITVELVVKRLMKFYATGLAAGLIAVAAACLLIELRDTTLKNTVDVRALLRQPILGTVTPFHWRPDYATPDSAIPHPSVRYLHAPTSMEAECYRSIRTALSVVTEDREARVLQITSPEPGDGKTTLAANLAVAVAQSGKRVLLIDADIRRPNVHKLFRVQRDVGLADVLEGRADLMSAVVTSSVERLSLLVAGKATINPAELLSSGQLGTLLNYARTQFDAVFVDTPPMLAVSDPAVVARYTNGVLLVVRVNKNRRAAAIRTREIVKTNNMPVLGIVVNSFSATDGGGYYYNEYLNPQRDQSPVSDETLIGTEYADYGSEVSGTPVGAGSGGFR